MFKRRTLFFFILLLIVAGAVSITSYIGSKNKNDYTKKSLFEIRQTLTEINSEDPITHSKISSDYEKWLTINRLAKKVSVTGVDFENSMILSFREDLTIEDLKALSIEHQFKISEVYPNLNSAQIYMDFSNVETTRIEGLSEQFQALSSSTEIAQGLRLDPKILEASPNFAVVGDVEFSGYTNIQESGSEILDWGISDIQADKLWSHNNAINGVDLAIIDTGFARHEDLVYKSLDSSADNLQLQLHGTHVAGIACAKHNNVGTSGVLPNCHIVPVTTSQRYSSQEDVDLEAAEAVQDAQYRQAFSDIISEFERLIETPDGVKVVSISLGYNIMEVFKINPDYVSLDPEDKDGLRAEILRNWLTGTTGQSLSIFRRAQMVDKGRGIAIFTSAGNDSSRLPTPMTAEYASPFNTAAFVGRTLTGEKKIENVMIVEAHDDQGKTARFSNVGGDISCPGVKIVSTLPIDATGNSSNNHIGESSGTSMATPYCAAGYALLKSIYPKYKTKRLIGCLENTSSTSTSETPMMKLEQAVKNCKQRGIFSVLSRS